MLSLPFTVSFGISGICPLDSGYLKKLVLLLILLIFLFSFLLMVAFNFLHLLPFLKNRISLLGISNCIFHFILQGGNNGSKTQSGEVHYGQLYWANVGNYFFKFFFCLPSYPSGTPIVHSFGFLKLVHISLMHCSFKNSFSIFHFC